MSNETPPPGNDLPLPPPTGAPVDLPPPPKKPLYRKWWFWVIVAFGLLFVISALSSSGDSEDASGTADAVVEEVAAEEVVEEAPATEPEPVVAEEPIEEPTEEPSEEPTEEPTEATTDDPAGDSSAADDTSADEPSAGFIFLARGDMADLAKDLDDMAVAAAEGGYFRLLGNSLELSFNIGQLQSLTPPAEIAEDWTSGLAKVSKRVDAISDAISNDGSTQEVLNRINSAAKALVQLSKVVDRVDP